MYFIFGKPFQLQTLRCLNAELFKKSCDLKPYKFKSTTKQHYMNDCHTDQYDGMLVICKQEREVTLITLHRNILVDNLAHVSNCIQVKEGKFVKPFIL